VATGLVFGDVATALAVAGAWGLIALALRTLILALEPDAVVSPLRRWLLLYNPPRASIAALHVLFGVMAFCWIVPVPESGRYCGLNRTT
jgi:mannose/fructose/N-acetylgalactosamine-specific phosphotransferase system component IIC